MIRHGFMVYKVKAVFIETHPSTLYIVKSFFDILSL